MNGSAAKKFRREVHKEAMRLLPQYMAHVLSMARADYQQQIAAQAPPAPQPQAEGV
jgi:hypothetical protein